MKPTQNLLIMSMAIFFLSALQTACTSSRTTAKKQTIIAGKIEHVKDETFLLSYDEYDLLAGTKNKRVPIDSDGNFHVALDITAPMKGSLYFGRDMIDGRGFNKNIYVYVSPGDSIFITANTDVLTDSNAIQNTLHITGTNAAPSRFMNEQDWAFNSYPQLRQNNYLFIYSLGPDAYKQNADSIRDEQIRFVKKYADTARLPQFMQQAYISEVENLASARKIAYPSGHASFTKKTNVELPENYYDFMDDIKISDNLEQVGMPYLRFANFYFQNKYALKKKEGYTEDYLTFLESEMKQRPRYILMAYSLGGNFSPEVYAKFGEGTPYSDLQKIVSDRYGHLEKMLPGRQAPVVVLKDIDGKAINSGDAFNGKFTYIDFWATWCKPCIKEIPDLLVLKDEYAHQNIEFVSISIDAERDEWEEYVKKEKMAGLQYWVDEKNKAIYGGVFNINMIPRFVLLDDKGRIVHANAPRPSSGEDIRKLLNESLAKSK